MSAQIIQYTTKELVDDKWQPTGRTYITPLSNISYFEHHDGHLCIILPCHVGTNEHHVVDSFKCFSDTEILGRISGYLKK